MKLISTTTEQTSNSPNNTLNPQLYSNLEVIFQQQLLAGFGTGPNLRYLRIARTNQKIGDIAFKAQIIATVTQISNIYWDLVNAYDTEQVGERSVAFATETLDTSRKQLALQAIPEMDVLKAESEVATRQQDLTVARTNLELQELYMKNAITRSFDDPVLQELPVVPTDHLATQIQPETEPVQQSIADALKNRTEIQENALDLSNRELTRKIRSQHPPAAAETLWLLLRDGIWRRPEPCVRRKQYRPRWVRWHSRKCAEQLVARVPGRPSTPDASA